MKEYKIKITVKDRYGVLNRITALFSRLQININDLMLDNSDCSDKAYLFFSFMCTEEKEKLLSGRIEKIYDVYSVEKVI